MCDVTLTVAMVNVSCCKGKKKKKVVTRKCISASRSVKTLWVGIRTHMRIFEPS